MGAVVLKKKLTPAEVATFDGRGLQLSEKKMMLIITTLISIIMGSLAVKLYDSRKRLNGSEFFLLSLVACVFAAALVTTAIQLWSAGTGALEAPVVPPLIAQLFSAYEILISVALQWAVISSIFVFFLKLRNWPEWLDADEDKRLAWQIALSKRYCRVMIALEFIFVPHALYRWHPVWGQWF